MAIARTPEDRFEYVLKADRKCAHTFGTLPCVAEGNKPCDGLVESCPALGCFEHKMPLSGQTVFVLRSTTWPENIQIKRYVEHGDNAGAEDYALRSCLIDWRNFRDASGAEVVFARKVINGKDLPDPANLERIDPYEMAAELFSAIVTRGQVTEDERKN